MKLDDFKSFLRRKPFRLFEVFTASGESYKVASPEAIWVSPEGDVVIAYPPEGGLALLDVEYITEVIDPPPRRASKGVKRERE